MMTTKNAPRAALSTAVSVEGKPPAPAGIKSTAKSRKPAKATDVREPKDKTPMKRVATDGSEYAQGMPAKKFVAVERSVPVTVEQKFEDRIFYISVDDLPTELREFALRQCEIPYKGPGANPEIRVRVEPVYEGGGTESGVLENLQFTVSFPVNN